MSASPFPGDAAVPHEKTRPASPRGDTPAEIPRQPDPLERTGAHLRLRRGPHAGEVFPLREPTIALGRHHECDIVLDDTTVSRRHAEIRRDGEGRYFLADSGSLNGTYLNRAVVDRAEIRDGDEIWIGKIRLTFHLG